MNNKTNTLNYEGKRWTKTKSILLVSLSALLLFILIFFLYNLDTSSFIYNLNSNSGLRQDFHQAQSGLNPLGTISIASSGKQWQLKSKTGTEANLQLWLLNAKDKKTEIGFLVPNNSCVGWNDMTIYNENGISIKDDKNKNIVLKCESSKCSGLNCYHISLTNAQSVNVNEYIKLGTNSFVTTYEDVNSIFYDFVKGNATLTLRNKDMPLNVNNLTIQENTDNYKFGAIDNAVNETQLNNYSYTLNSTNELYANKWKYYIITGDKNTHQFNFLDICSRSFNGINSNCSFILSSDKKNLEVSFISDKYIDPIIEIYIIIKAIKAIELNLNRTFIRDVYEQVKELDNNYTTIKDGNYLRVTFESNLTNDKDITIYAKDSCNGTILINSIDVPCEVYEKKKRIDEVKMEMKNEN